MFPKENKISKKNNPYHFLYACTQATMLIKKFTLARGQLMGVTTKANLVQRRPEPIITN